jgi:NodT family efflux transporter outer membrane factor (OMF) lipoprotein
MNRPFSILLHAVAAAAAGAVLLIAAAGCTVGPDYHQPVVKVPDRFAGPAAAAATMPADNSSTASDLAHWWTSFNDPKLDDLLRRAYASNLDLKAAQARLLEARAQFGIAGAALYPTADATGSYTRQQISKNGAFNLSGTNGAVGATPFRSLAGAGFKPRFDLFQAGFDSNWEIDVFGGTRRGIEAAAADQQSAIEDRRAVLVSLLGEVARNYVQYRGLQQQIAITRQNLQTDSDSLEVTRTRFNRGLTDYLDVARADSQLQSTLAQLPAQETSLRQALYQLGVLLGTDPAALSAELEAPAPVPVAQPIPQGLPSELLRRRPDVREAERQLAAATARIGVAVADLYPKFTLTGSLGRQSIQLKTLANAASTAWSFGPSVDWRIFDAGRIRSNIDVYNARQQEALVNYQQKVLTSLQDVDNALTAFANEQLRHEALVKSVHASRDAFSLASRQYSGGLTGYLTQLDAQRTLSAAQDQLAQSDTAVAADLVAVYKALGGGWEQQEMNAD